MSGRLGNGLLYHRLVLSGLRKCGSMSIPDMTDKPVRVIKERPWARKTHCKYGHELTPENVYTRWRADVQRMDRSCKTCKTFHRNNTYAAITENLHAIKSDWTKCNRCSTAIPMREVKQDLKWLVEHKKACKGGSKTTDESHNKLVQYEQTHVFTGHRLEDSMDEYRQTNTDILIDQW